MRPVWSCLGPSYRQFVGRFRLCARPHNDGDDNNDDDDYDGDYDDDDDDADRPDLWRLRAGLIE